LQSATIYNKIKVALLEKEIAFIEEAVSPATAISK
jgi:hypothetical protein